MLTTDLPHNGL